MSMWQTGKTQYLLNQVALSNSVRRLWVNHNIWLRALMFSIIYGIGDREAVEERLRQNADEFTTLFAQFYGQDTGNRIRENYLRHVQNVARLIEAYRDNDVSAITDARTDLYQTGDALAQIYSEINRFWDRATLQAYIDELINLTENQIARIVNGDFSQSIQEYDQFMEQGYRLSDELTFGMLKQFQV